MGFTQDGTGPTAFWRAGEAWANGLAIYVHPTPTDPNVSDRIGISIDNFVLDRYPGYTEILQDATINLSVATIAVTVPTAAWIALPTLAPLDLNHYARRKGKMRS